jgi:2-(1,2-epoxy-1,2-dihydrophenyl)acetyl-CoA isomerase
MTPTFETVDLSVRDEVAYVTLNRPHRLNAVNGQLADELATALETCVAKSPTAVLIVGGGRAFCSGYDLKESVSNGDQQAHVGQIERVQDVTRLLRRIPCPVVAGVRGYALGAGCEIALGCDLIIAEANAVFGFPEVGVGLGITGGVTELLPRVVGPTRAKWLVFFSERLTAAEAQELGMINLVVGDGQLETTCDDVVRRISGLPRFALSVAKRQLNSGFSSDFEAVLSHETTGAIACQESHDALEAANAFQVRSAAKETA